MCRQEWHELFAGAKQPLTLLWGCCKCSAHEQVTLDYNLKQSKETDPPTWGVRSPSSHAIWWGLFDNKLSCLSCASVCPLLKPLVYIRPPPSLVSVVVKATRGCGTGIWFPLVSKTEGRSCFPGLTLGVLWCNMSTLIPGAEEPALWRTVFMSCILNWGRATLTQT